MDIEWYVADRFRLRLLALAAAALLPMVALGQGADELASMIEQSFEGIEFRIDIRPQQAASDLEAQGRASCGCGRGVSHVAQLYAARPIRPALAE